MENKETIIEIKGIETKDSKTGMKYFSILTEQGAVTCFEKAITDELKKNIGNHVKVEIATNERGFRNVRKFLGLATAEESKTVETPAKVDVFAEARQEKNKSCYVSYAKDIFMELIKSKLPEEPEQAVMLRAIKLVKMAIQSFEDQSEIIFDTQ
jgi:hypothetical protein